MFHSDSAKRGSFFGSWPDITVNRDVWASWCVWVKHLVWRFTCSVQLHAETSRIQLISPSIHLDNQYLCLCGRASCVRVCVCVCLRFAELNVRIYLKEWTMGRLLVNHCLWLALQAQGKHASSIMIINGFVGSLYPLQPLTSCCFICLRRKMNVLIETTFNNLSHLKRHFNFSAVKILSAANTDLPILTVNFHKLARTFRR